MGKLKSTEDLLGMKELKTVALYKALAAEFLGTLILVLFGCASTLGPEPDIVKISLTFGLTLQCLIQALDHISGCHVNPSVTIGMLVARYVSVTRTILYIIVQCLGGIAGAAILLAITPEDNRYGMGVSHINEKMSVGQAFIVEIVCTFVLVLTIFGSTDDRRTDVKGSISLAIGIAAVATHLFGIPYTGASLNAARTFGPAVVMGEWENHWVYWVAPAVGGILAAVVYTLFFRGQYKRVKQEGATAVPLIPVNVKDLKHLNEEN